MPVFVFGADDDRQVVLLLVDRQFGRFRRLGRTLLYR